jgi:hypothetical protein
MFIKSRVARRRREKEKDGVFAGDERRREALATPAPETARY